MSREVSREKERETRENPERDEAVGSLSLGLMQSRRSSEVSEAGEVKPAGDTPSATDAYPDNSAAQVQAINEDITLRRRLVALEHVLAAVAELLSVGDVERARALVGAWTPPAVRNSRSPE